jgi:hypothetical protein
MPGFKDLSATYWREALNLRRTQPECFHGIELLRFFPRWARSLDGVAGPLLDELPWINFSAIQLLKSTLRPQMRVFEFGSGGSTMFFSRRVKEVVSVEHDPLWHAKIVQAARDRNRTNCELHLREPVVDPSGAGKDPSDPDAYLSTDEQFRGKSFHAYAKSIEVHPAETFDVVLVDGRARPSCLKHAIGKVKVGGLLVVDNAERAEYQRSYQLLDNPRWKRKDFFGPGPYNPYFWQTTIWKRVP